MVEERTGKDGGDKALGRMGLRNVHHVESKIRWDLRFWIGFPDFRGALDGILLYVLMGLDGFFLKRRVFLSFYMESTGQFRTNGSCRRGCSLCSSTSK